MSKFEFEENPKKIVWVNEVLAKKYMDALIESNPICFKEYITKVKENAINEFVNAFDDYRSCEDRDFYAMEMVREVAEKLKEKKQ